jgi:hypothetical protein
MAKKAVSKRGQKKGAISDDTMKHGSMSKDMKT